MSINIFQLVGIPLPLVWFALLGGVFLLRLVRCKKWSIFLWIPTAAFTFSCLFLAVISFLGMWSRGGQGPDAGFAAMGAMFAFIGYGPFGLLAIGYWWARPIESFRRKRIVVGALAGYVIMVITVYQIIYYSMTWIMIVEFRRPNGSPAKNLKVQVSVRSKTYGSAFIQKIEDIWYTDKDGRISLRVLNPESFSFRSNSSFAENVAWHANMDSRNQTGQAKGTITWMNRIKRGEPIRNQVNGLFPINKEKPVVLHLMPLDQFVMLPPLEEVNQLLKQDFASGLARCTNGGSTTTLLLPHFEQLDRYLTENPPKNLQILSDLRSLLFGLDRACNTWISFDRLKRGALTQEGAHAMNILYSYFAMVPALNADGLQQKKMLQAKIKEMQRRLEWHEERYRAAKSQRTVNSP